MLLWKMFAFCENHVLCLVFLGKNRILQNIQGEVFQFPGLLFLYLLCLENFYGTYSIGFIYYYYLLILLFSMYYFYCCLLMFISNNKVYVEARGCPRESVLSFHFVGAESLVLS